VAVVRGIPGTVGWRVRGPGLLAVLGVAGLEQIRSAAGVDTRRAQAQNEDMMRWLRNLLRMRKASAPFKPLPPPARDVAHGDSAPRPYRDIDDFMRPANPPDWE